MGPKILLHLLYYCYISIGPVDFQLFHYRYHMQGKCMTESLVKGHCLASTLQGTFASDAALLATDSQGSFCLTDILVLSN